IVAGGRVCTLGISGILACFDAATGKPLWRKQFGAEFSKTSPTYGTGMSPMMDGNLLIAHVGGAGGGALRAFDAATGQTKWSWAGDGPGYTSPLIFNIGGTRQLVTHSERKIIGVAPDSGKLLWEIPFRTPYDQNIVTPVLHDGKLILSGLRQPTMLVDIRKDGDTWQPKKRWESAESTMYMSSPVLAGNLLFGFTNRNSGQMFCLDPRSGKILWTGPPRAGDNAAILLSGDTLLILTDDAQLTIAQATADRYDVVKQYSVADSPTWAHPVPCGPGLLIKDKTTLALWTW
ncbi:MAG: PQQ-binding-like beta-propeller repeat protein, partial [bacterium]|nr:PQQ-binding-like beta-propeller repeat protein [bacterium]